MARISTIILIIILISGTCYSQIRIGVLGSGNSTTFSGDAPPSGSYSSTIGYGFGASVDYHFSSDIVLNFQPMFTDKSTIIQFDVNYQYDKVDSIKINIDYFELPLAVKVIANNYFTYVTAGLSINIPLSASLKNQRTNETEDIKDDLNKMFASAIFGVGIQFNIGTPKMFIEARYSQGLTNLTNGSLGEGLIKEKIKSNSWYLLGGLLFTL